MKCCIVKAHRGGLFSLINKVITCAEIYDHVHVDWSNGTLYTDPGDNLWNHLFEPTEDRGGDIIEEYPHQNYTYKNAAELYLGSRGHGWQWRLHGLAMQFPVNDVISGIVHDWAASHGTQGVSVIVRAHGHAGEQVSGRSQEISEYEEAIRAIEREHGSVGPVRVLSNSTEVIARLGEKMSVVSDDRVRRSSSRADDFHLCCKQSVLDAQMCLVEVITASAARFIIHPVSNMATAALYLNPRSKSIYLP